MGNYGDFWNGSLVMDHSDHHVSMSTENLYAAAEVSVLTGIEATKHSGIFGWLFNLVHGYPFWVLLLPLLVSISGFSLAFLMYMRGGGASKHISYIEDNGGSPLYNFLLNKWYIDEVYEIIFVKWVRKMGDIFWKIGDQKIIDGFGPNGISLAVSRTSKRLSKLQSGYLYHYAFFMLLGVALIVIVVFSKVGG
jgi:NADH-quinone oxidoreductase subunit L